MDSVGIYPYNAVSELDRVTAYAHEVVSGRIIAGQTQRQACERHLRDLERQGTAEFPFVFDAECAQVLIDFAEALTLAEGEEPEPLQLWGFQDFIFGSWHGWLTLDGYRRFRTSYVQVARQNGKSLGNAVPSLFYGNFDGYNYPQIYCAATKEDQARIVLKECLKFIKADPELCGSKYETGLFTSKEYKSMILCNNTRGEIKAIGRDTETIDGFRPYFASVDEYHKHKTNQMYKLLTGGQRKLKQCLTSIITTAGFDLNLPCYEEYEYGKMILAGLHHDETHFVFICELDKDDDIWDESNWPKANPLWTEETLTSLRSDALKAKQKGGSDLRDFMTKALNIWVMYADKQFMNLQHWKDCESDLTIADMAGRECYLGLDLSSGGDLTSGALEFPIDDEETGERKYFIDSHSWIPSARVAEHVKTDSAPYDMWIMEGLLTPTETMGGVKTDYKYIIAHYRDLIKKYNLKLKGIGYDPHNADAFLSDLEEFGVDTVEVIQSARSLNDATVDFRLEAEAKNLMYDRRNKLLTWSMANAKTTGNSFGEIKIDKEPNAKTKRIDPIDAVIDSHKLLLSMSAKNKKSVYEEREVRVL